MSIQENIKLALHLIPKELVNTLYMVFVSFIISTFLGGVLGAILFIYEDKGPRPNSLLYKILSNIFNIFRAIPFSILIILLFPFTRLIVGSSIGTTASIVPLVVGAIPLIGRLVQEILSETYLSFQEVFFSLNASVFQIIKVIIKESAERFVKSLTLLLITLVNYSSLAGLVGGGGLGQLAIQYGYYRFNSFIMFSVLMIVILLIGMIQTLGYFISNFISSKKGGLKK